MTHASLETELRRLQTDYAIDDSLIESLTASPEQARVHIRFWKQMKWIANGGGIVISLVLGVAALRYASQGVSLLLYAATVICFTLAGLCLLTLMRQRKAISEVQSVARHHGLI